jgi:hypothetical protein
VGPGAAGLVWGRRDLVRPRLFVNDRTTQRLSGGPALDAIPRQQSPNAQFGIRCNHYRRGQCRCHWAQDTHRDRRNWRGGHPSSRPSRGGTCPCDRRVGGYPVLLVQHLKPSLRTFDSPCNELRRSRPDPLALSDGSLRCLGCLNSPPHARMAVVAAWRGAPAVSPAPARRSALALVDDPPDLLPVRGGRYRLEP